MSHRSQFDFRFPSPVDFALQLRDSPRLECREPAFFAQRQGQLAGLIGLKWFLQQQQFVIVAEPRKHIVPGVIAVRGADHDLQTRVDLPQFFRRFQTVHAARHPHVNEGNGEAASLVN